MLGFFFVDAIEGNEEALREEREKLRRRKAREERCAQKNQKNAFRLGRSAEKFGCGRLLAETMAAQDNERLLREAEVTPLLAFKFKFKFKLELC